MLKLQTVPQPHPEIVDRILENEAVLVLPIRGKVKVLNELGARIWTLVDGKRSIGDIIRIISQEYDAPAETITADTTEFLAQLADRGIITFA